MIDDSEQSPAASPNGDEALQAAIPDLMPTSHPQASSAKPGWLDWLGQGLRAGFLRSVRQVPEGPDAWQMLLIAGFITAAFNGLLRFEVVGAARFDWRIWLFSWASTALMIVGVWLVLSWGRVKAVHSAPAAAWYLLFTVAMFPVGLVSVGLTVATTHGWLPSWWTGSMWIGWVVFAAFSLWVALAAWRVTKAVNRSAWVAIGIVLHVLMLQGLDSFVLRTQSWQPVYEAANDADVSDDDSNVLRLSQEVFEKQQVLLDEALLAVKAHDGDKRQTYGLIYAPYAQDVFLRESATVQDVLEQRFHAQGRVIRFVNHPTTATQIPWATNRNLERSLQALASAMDIERDVLVLYLTSHGGADFTLASSHWPLEVDALTANQLRDMLDKAGIRNRVIAVSACYSGGWVEPLQSDNTLVMTAADKDHTSYGCGSKSELTFFGRAVFDEQLRKTLSFEAAFNAAVPIIKQREIDGEKSDGFSNPQISVGKDIRIVLSELTE